MKRGSVGVASVVVLLVGLLYAGTAWAESAGPCQALALAAANLRPGTSGEAYSQKLPVFGGTAPVRVMISEGVLPPGLALAADGTLSGTPRSAGEYSLTVTATDSCLPPQSASQQMRLVVAEKGGALQSQPSIVKERRLAITVQAMPAAVSLPAGESTLQVSYRLTAQPRETAVIESPGRSFLIDGAVIASEGVPLSATLVNGVGEVKETLTLPRSVLDAIRQTPGAKILQNRPFIGHGTTALGLVEISIAPGKGGR